MRCWRPGDDPLERGVEVLVANLLLLVAAGEDGGLVADVREVGAGQPGGLPRDPSQVDVRRQRLAARVDGQDRLAAGEVGRADEHLAVEAPGPKQGRVEILEPVRGADDDDLGRGGEAVQLDEELVQGLVVLAVEARSRAAHADRVELVDEDDRRRVLARAVSKSLRIRAAPSPANISTNAEALCE